MKSHFNQEFPSHFSSTSLSPSLKCTKTVSRVSVSEEALGSNRTVRKGQLEKLRGSGQSTWCPVIRHSLWKILLLFDFGVAPHMPQGLCWIWYGASSGGVLLSFYISYCSQYLFVSPSQRASTTEQEHAGNQCVLSNMLSLPEVQQSKRRTRRVGLTSSPLSTPSCRNGWPSPDSWSWPSGPLAILVRSQMVNTIRFLLEFCSVWAGFRNNLWAPVFYQPSDTLSPSQRPSNWGLLGPELQKLSHFHCKEFLFFSFMKHRFVLELLLSHTQNRYKNLSNFPSGLWFKNKSPYFIVAPGQVTWELKVYQVN